MAGKSDKRISQPISDIAEWGERPQSGYALPLVIDGREVNLNELPPLSDGDADSVPVVSTDKRARLPLRR